LIWLLIAARLAEAIRSNIAAANGAPQSIALSIADGVPGAAVAAGGWEAVFRDEPGKSAASREISPLIGGLVAAAISYRLS